MLSPRNFIFAILLVYQLEINNVQATFILKKILGGGAGVNLELNKKITIGGGGQGGIGLGHGAGGGIGHGGGIGLGHGGGIGLGHGHNKIQLPPPPQHHPLPLPPHPSQGNTQSQAQAAANTHIHIHPAAYPQGGYYPQGNGIGIDNNKVFIDPNRPSVNIQPPQQTQVVSQAQAQAQAQAGAGAGLNNGPTYTVSVPQNNPGGYLVDNYGEQKKVIELPPQIVNLPAGHGPQNEALAQAQAAANAAAGPGGAAAANAAANAGVQNGPVGLPAPIYSQNDKVLTPCDPVRAKRHIALGLPELDLKIPPPPISFKSGGPGGKLDLGLPKFGAELEAPKVEAPAVEAKAEPAVVDASLPSAEIQAPSVQAPSLELQPPFEGNVELPSSNVEVSSPEVQAPSLSVESGVPQGEVSAEAPGVSVSGGNEKVEGQGLGLNLGLPGFKFSN